VADGAHNRDSAQKLAAALADYFPGRRATLIFGASSDKDIAGMLAELLPRVSRAIMTQAIHPRAWDPEEVARLAHEAHAHLPIEVVSPVAQALERALQLSAPDDVVVACGSLFVVAEVRTAWEERKKAFECMESGNS
jgi:folylpolyglutamate synthase/dihydropteroate synthase